VQDATRQFYWAYLSDQVNENYLFAFLSTMVLCLSSMFCGPAGAARAAAAAVAVLLLLLPPILALTAEPLLVTPPPLRLAPSMLSLQVSGAANFVSFDWHLSHTITTRLYDGV
jgi:hypothetical protein